jgi:hypothetical protein
VAKTASGVSNDRQLHNSTVSASSCLPHRHAAHYTSRRKTGAAFKMATFNKIFTTQRLLQIIFVLGATFIMKLMS